MSFQRLSSAAYESEYTFSNAFVEAFLDIVGNKKKNITGFHQEALERLKDASKHRLNLSSVQNQNMFIMNESLNMDFIMERFAVTFSDLYSKEDNKFIENNGRKFFLLFYNQLSMVLEIIM